MSGVQRRRFRLLWEALVKVRHTLVHQYFTNTDLESGLNPAAEAFRNFDADPGISSLSLDNSEETRRAAASRANSVRFDESANNHYGSSRQSIDLPTRTGSGLGSHPLSERSLSHRSDGRGSTTGFPRNNSFGLESSRLLGSIHNSPKVSGNPPPGFFVLGPCPSIIRCWLTETFSNDSLLYAAICSGSSISTVGRSLLQKLDVADQITEEGGLQKIKLPVFLTEARIAHPSSRSASPAPQVPTLIAKFVVVEESTNDASIQIILGSDILRAQNADILFSQDKLSIFDEDRNQLSIPLVRPENEEAYRSLTTRARGRSGSIDFARARQASQSLVTEHRAGIIGRPSRLDIAQSPRSPTSDSPVTGALTATTESTAGDVPPRPSIEGPQPKQGDDSKSTTGSEKSYTAPAQKSASGVWGSSWRSASSTQPPEDASKPSSGYSKAATSRTMKVLRPTKSSVATPRAASSPWGALPSPAPKPEEEVKQPTTEVKTPTSATTKSNPIGSGSAFGWLNSGQQRRTTANGSGS
jgi:hypothetical protein